MAKPSMNLEEAAARISTRPRLFRRFGGRSFDYARCAAGRTSTYVTTANKCTARKYGAKYTAKYTAKYLHVRDYKGGTYINKLIATGNFRALQVYVVLVVN
jgi:fructose-1,6-bisphosphatase/inositol monophosphatase family enzyme